MKAIDYRLEAHRQARDCALHYLDDITDQIACRGEASADLIRDHQDGDEYHHVHHVDKAYDLKEAAEVLTDLEEFHETDGGLWEGLSPRNAICTQAVYTYGNAVYHFWGELVGKINKDPILLDFLADCDDPEECVDVIREIVRSIIKEG